MDGVVQIGWRGQCDYTADDLLSQPRCASPKLAEAMSFLGELLAKGTCRICHDATGPGRDALASTPGLIPSLASLPEQNPVMSVIRKVREGAPAPGLPGSRGEMPVFSYLTADEVTATYFYLLIYPPRESSVGR